MGAENQGKGCLGANMVMVSGGQGSVSRGVMAFSRSRSLYPHCESLFWSASGITDQAMGEHPGLALVESCGGGGLWRTDGTVDGDWTLFSWQHTHTLM